MIRAEYALLATITIGLFTIYFGLRNLRRVERHDTEKDTEAKARMTVVLENLSTGIIEIKGDTREIRRDMTEINKQLIHLEKDITAAHKRIDVLEKK